MIIQQELAAPNAEEIEFPEEDEGIVQVVPYDMFNFPNLLEDHETLAKRIALFIASDPNAGPKMVAKGFHSEEIAALCLLGRGEITHEESINAIIHALEARWDSVIRSPNVRTVADDK